MADTPRTPLVEPIYQEIGRLIRARREQVGLTQGQLAAAVEMSRPSVVNIEQGRQRIAVHDLYDLAAALHTSPALLAPYPKAVRRDWIFFERKTVKGIDSERPDAPS